MDKGESEGGAKRVSYTCHMDKGAWSVTRVRCLCSMDNGEWSEGGREERWAH